MIFNKLKVPNAIGICLGLTLVCGAQNAPSQSQDQQQTAAQTPPAAPSPLPTPAITGPLQAAPPHVLDSERLGKFSVNGIISGMGLWQGNHVPGDDSTQAALTNGQLFFQKTDGWLQFYVQAGAYDIPALGTSFVSTENTLSNFYGPVPVGFLKLVPAKNTSILIGSLPTLIGAEYTFTFENMNVNRGLLWNQENAINRGIQLNQTIGKVTASFSWNDGFYSNRYTWLSGSLTYANGPHALTFVAGGNYSQTAYQTAATPVQNNSRIYDVIYTFTKSGWIVQPYFQYSDVPTNHEIGVEKGASARGIALLVNRTLKHGFSLAGRVEYLSSTGKASENSVNLMYGPGSSAWSVTVTPTYQIDRFFIRADLSYVRANDFTPGFAFGPAGMNQNQPRGVIEAGFLF